MPQQEIDQVALREMKEVNLPSAKPPVEVPDRFNENGDVIYGRTIPGRTIPGTLPTRDIPFQEYPKVLYLWPKKPYRKLMVPIDGHGNKEWQWVPNAATSIVVKNKKDEDAAGKKGYVLAPFVLPDPPTEGLDEEIPL